MSSYQSLVEFAQGIKNQVVLEAPATEGVEIRRNTSDSSLRVQVKGSQSVVYRYRRYSSGESWLESPAGRKVSFKSSRIPHGLREALLFLDSVYHAQRSGDFSNLQVGSDVLKPQDMQAILNHAQQLKNTLNSLPQYTGFDSRYKGASLVVGLVTRGVTFEFSGSSPNITVKVMNNGELVQEV